jgi:hypothetical protein
MGMRSASGRGSAIKVSLAYLRDQIDLERAKDAPDTARLTWLEARRDEQILTLERINRRARS